MSAEAAPTWSRVLRAYTLLIVALLAGCGAATNIYDDVTKPPPPNIGEALDRIVARLAPALAPDETEPGRQRKRRLAVAPVAHSDGSIKPFSHRLAAALITRLSALPDLTVIERGQMAYVMEEQSFAHGGSVDERTSAQLGRIIGADCVLLGSYHPGGDALTLNLRVVEVETSAVLASAEEATRPDEEAQEPPPLPPAEDLRRSIAVDFLVLGETRLDGPPRPIQVTEGTTLASGDHFQVHVTPRQDGQVYVLLAGASGRLVRIFPAPGQSALVAASTALQIPPAGPQPWFKLDGQTGTETLYLVAWDRDVQEGERLGQTLSQVATWSEAQQRPELATSLEDLARTIQERVALRQKLRQRFPRPPLAAPLARNLATRDGAILSLLPELAEGTGVLVRCVKFQHR